MDVWAMLLISIPIYLPIIDTLGYDAIWLGIIMIIAVEMALITPPVGFNLFVIKNFAPEGVTLLDIIKGAIPFVIIIWVLLALLVAFPQIALWLPSTIRG